MKAAANGDEAANIVAIMQLNLETLKSRKNKYKKTHPSHQNIMSVK
jgi:hypothetical protein